MERFWLNFIKENDMSKYLKINVGYSDLEDAVKRVIFDRMRLDEPFTAYDVTKTLREDVGPIVNIEHDGVKEIVHQYMDLVYQLGFYDRIYDHEVTYNKFATLYSPTNAWKEAKRDKISGNIALNVNIPAVHVESSLVECLSFKGTVEKGEVEIELKDDFYNKSYIYADVPFSVFLQIVNAESVGQAYNKYLRGQYAVLK